MQVTDEMVRVAAAAICKTLFGPFDLAELAHPSSSSAQSVIAAEAALTAALAAMWQDIGGDPYKLPQDGMYLALNDMGQVCPVEARGGYRLIRAMPGFIEWDPRTSIIAFMPLPAPSQLSKRGDAERDSIQEA